MLGSPGSMSVDGVGFLKATDVTRCSTTKLLAEQAVSCTATWNLAVLKFFSSNNFSRQGLCIAFNGSSGKVIIFQGKLNCFPRF